MMIKKIMLLVCVFFLGVIAANIYAYYSSGISELQGFQLPAGNEAGGYEYQTDNALTRAMAMLQGSSTDVPSPSDWITEDKIIVTKDKVIINIQGAEWASFTDTNSMDPVIDIGANAIEVIPASADELQVGDIVAYESEYAEGTIIHRIVYKGQDEQGVYFVLKGDNNPINDPGKVRFEQIKRVVVAIIY